MEEGFRANCGASCTGQSAEHGYYPINYNNKEILARYDVNKQKPTTNHDKNDVKKLRRAKPRPENVCTSSASAWRSLTPVSLPTAEDQVIPLASSKTRP